MNYKHIKVISVVGARPNFMKVAPLHRAFKNYPHIESKLVHTGQHYDEKMSAVFFEQLELPHPDYYLGVGGGSHTQQTAKIMLAFEEILATEQPDLVLVVGDVNSTIACALVAVKMGIMVAHVEAGLRSGDRTMPEEINRMLTDTLADLLFVTEPSGITNLRREGISGEKIHFTGNCMIDSLVFYQEKSSRLPVLEQNNLRSKNFLLITMHRPSNVDTQSGLETMLRMIQLIAAQHPVVFPIHPRTRNNFELHGLLPALEVIENLILLEPQGYLEFQQLMAHAIAVLTDSGGVQEETTYLQVPCLTFRESTERPITVEVGSNVLLATLNPELACAKVIEILNGDWKQGKVPDLWDGKAADRIVAVIHQQFCVQLSHS
jgi:UDP-N-acetylglucosamine 2-epimerase (non-hydrolysing)